MSYRIETFYWKEIREQEPALLRYSYMSEPHILWL